MSLQPYIKDLALDEHLTLKNIKIHIVQKPQPKLSMDLPKHMILRHIYSQTDHNSEIVGVSHVEEPLYIGMPSLFIVSLSLAKINSANLSLLIFPTVSSSADVSIISPKYHKNCSIPYECDINGSEVHDLQIQVIPHEATMNIGFNIIYTSDSIPENVTASVILNAIMPFSISTHIAQVNNEGSLLKVEIKNELSFQVNNISTILNPNPSFIVEDSETKIIEFLSPNDVYSLIIPIEYRKKDNFDVNGELFTLLDSSVGTLAISWDVYYHRNCKIAISDIEGKQNIFPSPVSVSMFGSPSQYVVMKPFNVRYDIHNLCNDDIIFSFDILTLAPRTLKPSGDHYFNDIVLAKGRSTKIKMYYIACEEGLLSYPNVVIKMNNVTYEIPQENGVFILSEDS